MFGDERGESSIDVEWGEYIGRCGLLKLVLLELVVTLCDLPSSKGTDPRVA